MQFILLLPFAIFLRILLLALKPLIHIRFGQIHSPRLGLFAGAIELYLCDRDAGIDKQGTLDLWYHYDRDAYAQEKPAKVQEFISNHQLDKMWGRLIHITEWARHLHRLNGMLSRGSTTFTIADRHMNARDPDGLLGKIPPHLQFTDEEEAQGKLELQHWGIEPDDKFVCIHARDSVYLDTARPRNIESHGDWSWQDNRDATIGNYLLAAEKLADLGYFVIRMGKFTGAPLESDNPRIIDYATHHQSDFMDIYLSARCAFFVGQSSGMTAIPMAFRKPIVFVNVYPIWDASYCMYSGGIMVPKKYFSATRERFLTFPEVFDLGLGVTNVKLLAHQELFQSLGIKIEENTPEEISEAVLEMHGKLEKSFQTSEVDQQNQEQFVSAMRHPDGIPEGTNAPDPVASAHFLRTNSDLF